MSVIRRNVNVFVAFKSICSRIVDNMPIAWCYETQSDENFCSPGFPFGCYVDAEGEQHGACVISVS